MGSIERALTAAAFRLIDGVVPGDTPVEPALDCMTQALYDTCRLYGIAEKDMFKFFMSFAVKVRRLDRDVPDRQQLRQVEAQMMAVCGLGRPARGERD